MYSKEELLSKICRVLSYSHLRWHVPHSVEAGPWWFQELMCLSWYADDGIPLTSTWGLCYCLDTQPSHRAVQCQVACLIWSIFWSRAREPNRIVNRLPCTERNLEIIACFKKAEGANCQNQRNSSTYFPHTYIIYYNIYE